MSVSSGNRGKSGAQFVDTAATIEERAIQVCRRWPKSYMFFITQRTVELASELYEHAQKANTFFPIMTEREREERVTELLKALGANYAFAQKIELANALFPICGEKDNRSERENADKSARLFEEFMNLCLLEEDALKGNLSWTRAAKLGADQRKPKNAP